MPSFKPVVRKGRVNIDHKSRIYIRVGHLRHGAYIPTDWYIDPRFMGADGVIKTTYPGHASLNRDLLQLQVDYNNAAAGIGYEALRSMSIQELVRHLEARAKNDGDFIAYFSSRATALREQSRHSMADLYGVVLKHLKEFNRADRLQFRQITPDFLERFEYWLRKERKLSTNGIRNYMCRIRETFNRAIDIDRNCEAGMYPFRRYKIKQEKTHPRPASRGDLRRLLFARPYLSPSMKRALDVFFLMFYTGGTNLKDLLFMKHADLQKGRLVYERFKTDRSYSMPVIAEAQEIIDRYPGKEYLLCWIELNSRARRPDREKDRHKDFLSNTNKFLKLAAAECGLSPDLTTYVARYSFATMAAELDIPKDTIAHILGHGETTMTDLYIDFDQKKSDEAILKVIEWVIKS